MPSQKSSNNTPAVGDMVKLSKEGKRIRVSEMASWRGLVIGLTAFYDKRGRTMIQRAVVDWGKRREEKAPFVWMELYDHLVIS